MLKQIVAVGICIFALMLVIKDGRVLRMAGLTGSCSIVETYPDSSLLVGCRAGKLDGQPDLSRRACSSGMAEAGEQYWHCTAGFDISYTSR